LCLAIYRGARSCFVSENSLSDRGSFVSGSLPRGRDSLVSHNLPGDRSSFESDSRSSFAFENFPAARSSFFSDILPGQELMDPVLFVPSACSSLLSDLVPVKRWVQFYFVSNNRSSLLNNDKLPSDRNSFVSNNLPAAQSIFASESRKFLLHL
jgi:hypothetical protein